MKILITGVNGLLGYDLYRVLSKKHQVYGCGRKSSDFLPEKYWVRMDITKLQQTYETISKINPDLVIHAAAYSDVDGCERNPEFAYSVNSLGTRNVAAGCQRFDTIMVYISTDYVFDGGRGGYDEFDTPNPINTYGKSKYQGEGYVKHLLNKFYIIRTSWLFGKRRENFVTTIVKKTLNKETIKIVDQRGSPSYTLDLAKAISQLIEKPCYGIYHITNSGNPTRVEIVEKVFEILKSSTKVEMVQPKDVFFAARPKNSSLKNMCWELEGFKPLRSYHLAIESFIKEELKG